MNKTSELFILSHDERQRPMIQFRLPDFLRLKREVDKGVYSSIKDASIVMVPTSEYNIYPDVYDGQLFVFKENILNITKRFILKPKYQVFYVMDKQKKIIVRYYHLELPLIDIEPKNYNSLVEKMSKTCRHINRVSINGMISTIISVELAEAILRCDPEFTTLTRLCLED